MTPATAFAGKRVALFGLGGSGLATARALVAGGASVACWDDGEAGRAKAAAEGLAVIDLTHADWSRFSSLILSPGVPLTHPEPHWTVKLARAAGCEIIGDIEVFFRERAKLAPSAPVVAITGTNGKSTTTALTAHILRVAGRDVQMGGNIGTNILDLEPPDANRVHVIEMSSFQIDLTPSLAPTVGVLLNITPDHLDRHGTMANYAAIKERLVAASEQPIISIDDAYCHAIEGRLKNTDTISVSSESGARFFARGPQLFIKYGKDEPLQIADLANAPALRGAHNRQNALAALAVCADLCTQLGVELSWETFNSGLSTYASLPHRMQPIGSVGKVAFVNDSKATNADSTRGALAGGEGIFWILGGKAKEGGIEDLRPLFGAVAKAYLIGAATETFAATLEGVLPYQRCGTLDVAVAKAAADAEASAFAHPIVLLSPACASYDQYKSFEHRGAHFRALAAALPGFTPIHGAS